MTMKMIVAVPFALLSLGVLGCSQQANTAPAVQNPATAAPAQNDTNMFGENKEAAAGSAADARAAAYSSDPGAQSAPPK